MHLRRLALSLAVALALGSCASEQPKETERPDRQVQSISIDDAPTVAPSPEVVETTAPVAAEPAAAQPAAHMVSMNSKSHKYHEPGCRYYGCNSCDEVTLDEAVASGGVPCKKCH